MKNVRNFINFKNWLAKTEKQMKNQRNRTEENCRKNDKKKNQNTHMYLAQHVLASCGPDDRGNSERRIGFTAKGLHNDLWHGA
jgi:hypothetical protein